MKTIKGDLVGALFRVRQGRCQYNAGVGTIKAHCGAKTRLGIGVPVSDNDGLIGMRICGQHLEVVVERIVVEIRRK